jgi:hypothetical protein
VIIAVESNYRPYIYAHSLPAITLISEVVVTTVGTVIATSSTVLMWTSLGSPSVFSFEKKKKKN